LEQPNCILFCAGHDDHMAPDDLLIREVKLRAWLCVESRMLYVSRDTNNGCPGHVVLVPAQLEPLADGVLTIEVTADQTVVDDDDGLRAVSVVIRKRAPRQYRSLHDIEVTTIDETNVGDRLVFECSWRRCSL